MKKIFFVTSNLSRGGAEHVAAELAGKFAEDGYLVTIIYMKDRKTDYSLDENVQVEFLLGNGNTVRRIPEKIIRLRHLMKNNRDAVFVAMLPYETWYTFLAGIGLKLRKVYSLRNDPYHMKKVIHKLVCCFAYPFSDGIVFQTKDAMNFFPRYIQKKGYVIPNPIADGLPDPYVGKREKEFVSVGRLTPQKNFPLLFKVFARVNKRYPEWRLKIYGEGPQRDELNKLAEALGIDDKVIFAGFVSDVIDQINRSGCFVLSSDYEGISNAMLEAMATGVPCICTDCPIGGAAMTIQSGVNGLLTPVGDEAALENAMLWMIEHPEESERMSKEAVKVREVYSLQSVVGEWERVLNNE